MTSRTTLHITGIHCPSCIALIKDVSQDFPSIHSVNGNLGEKTVTLEHDENLDLSAWTRAVEELNPAYRVQPLSQKL